MNVLLIVADDMRQDHLPYMGFVNKVLRYAGATFEAMRAEVAVCTPARAGIASGQYAHHSANGVWTNLPASDIADVATHALPVWINAAGVTTGMFGKYTIPGVTAVQPGWDAWRVLSTNTQAPYGYNLSTDGVTSTPPGHQLDVITDEVITFVTGATEPWFCHFAPTNPHVNTSDFGNNPQLETLNLFDWVTWPFDEPVDVSTKPSWIQALNLHNNRQRKTMRMAVRKQLREVYDLDAKIQQIHAALEGAGRLDDTLIIFVSDGGVFYFEHRLPDAAGTPIPSTKEMPYDACSRTPCLLAGPGVPAGTTYRYPTVLQDVTATVVAAFGATPTVPLDGVDLRGLLTDTDPDRATLLQRQAGSGYPDGRAVVTATRKLIRWDGQVGDDQYEMYDLDSDPGEHVNVANEPERLTERAELEARLDPLLT